MHPRDWIEVRPQGVWCKAGDFYIDPMQPVERAVVTHGHADHARPLRRRSRGRGAAAGLGETVEIGDVRVSLYPAGHILGSAQARLEYAGSSIVFSGDYKRRPDPICVPFEPVPCDVFVTEATFALPVFRHPPLEDEIAKLLASLMQFPERCHLVGVYALGKCQRMICALRAAGCTETIYLHGAMVRLCKLYKSFGIALGPLELVTPENANALAGRIVLCPPSALQDRSSRKLPSVVMAAASGWMRIRARAKQKGVELPLVVSDHANWDQLTQTMVDVSAPEVWVTHGRDDALVYYAQQHGFKAQALHLLGYEDDSE